MHVCMYTSNYRYITCTYGHIIWRGRGKKKTTWQKQILMTLHRNSHFDIRASQLTNVLTVQVHTNIVHILLSTLLLPLPGL
jgi:hypothetical protein